MLGGKGIAVAIADGIGIGIGSSAVSHIASAAAVQGLLDDCCCTSEAWSVQTSVERVLRAINAWLNAQTQRSDHRFDRDRGYVCTPSALVPKGGTAHLFDGGDARIHRLQVGDESVEQLTTDHRVRVSDSENHLGWALGAGARVEINHHVLAL